VDPVNEIRSGQMERLFWNFALMFQETVGIRAKDFLNSSDHAFLRFK
jgi:hypothetical protein